MRARGCREYAFAQKKFGASEVGSFLFIGNSEAAAKRNPISARLMLILGTVEEEAIQHSPTRAHMGNVRIGDHPGTASILGARHFSKRTQESGQFLIFPLSARNWQWTLIQLQPCWIPGFEKMNSKPYNDRLKAKSPSEEIEQPCFHKVLSNPWSTNIYCRL